MFLKTRLAVAALALAAAGAANAGAIPYPNPGTQNPDTYTFTASSNGDLVAYFLGTGAAYNEDLGVLVNGVDTGLYGLPNHATAVDASFNFGTVHAGDVLTFFIRVQTTGDTFYSNKALNSDGVNHVYSTSFAGDGTAPAGTYVAFEDLNGGGDLNYHDETFSFVNVSTRPAVPEPTNVALLLAGLGLIGTMARRRQR
jgi:hypothetical protein